MADLRKSCFEQGFFADSQEDKLGTDHPRNYLFW
jgi:hypothetical protein